jgi:hypothetical protein
MASIALLFGKPKPKGKGEPEESKEALEGEDEESSSSAAEDYAREMFQALKDDDEDGFVAAAKALKECE